MRITIDIDPDQPRTQAGAAATTDVAASGMADVDAGPPSASQLAAIDAGPPSASLLAAIEAAGPQHPASTAPAAPLTATSQDASGGAAPT
jgi:hypothetical protein